MKIYFVTVFNTDKIQGNEKLDIIKRMPLIIKRTWAFFVNLDQAHEYIINNYEDIHEGRYNIALIEEYEEGCASCGEEIQWYKWNIKKYQECEKPEWTEGICNWSLG